MNYLSHHHEPKTVADGLVRLDIFKLGREVGLGAEADRVALDIGVGEVTARLDWESVFFGGARPWFLCPACSARRRFLHVKDGHVVCRGCANLAYASRHELWAGARSLRRAAKLRRLIGAVAFGDLPPRPRQHMAAKWYDRIVREIRLCEREALGAIVPVHAALTRRRGPS
jgi:hypothetical protein